MYTLNINVSRKKDANLEIPVSFFAIILFHEYSFTYS